MGIRKDIAGGELMLSNQQEIGGFLINQN